MRGIVMRLHFEEERSLWLSCSWSSQPDLAVSLVDGRVGAGRVGVTGMLLHADGASVAVDEEVRRDEGQLRRR